MLKDHNACWKWSPEFSNLSSCSKQGHLWGRWGYSGFYPIGSWNPARAEAVQLAAVLDCPHGTEFFPYIQSEILCLEFMCTMKSITPFCRPWQAAFRCPTTTTISSTGWTSDSPPVAADRVSVPSCSHLGVSPWSLGDTWLPQSTGRVAVLIKPGCSWLLLFKVSVLTELFPAEMLSLFYSVILEKIISFKSLCAIVWKEGGIWQSHKGNWRSKRLFCILLKLFSN